MSVTKTNVPRFSWIYSPVTIHDYSIYYVCTRVLTGWLAQTAHQSLFYKILPLSNFFSQPFLIFNSNLQWTFQCHLMMNNHMILFANEMSILQTLNDCNYIGIHKSIQKQRKKNYHCGSIPNSRNKSIIAIQLRNTHHQTTIKSFFSLLQ